MCSAWYDRTTSPLRFSNYIEFFYTKFGIFSKSTKKERSLEKHNAGPASTLFWAHLLLHLVTIEQGSLGMTLGTITYYTKIKASCMHEELPESRDIVFLKAQDPIVTSGYCDTAGVHRANSWHCAQENHCFIT